MQSEYSNVPRFLDERNLCRNLPKIQTKRLNLRVFCQNEANGMANSEALTKFGLYFCRSPVYPKTLISMVDLKFVIHKQDMLKVSQRQTTNWLIKLHRCAGRPAPWLMENRFSLDEAHFHRKVTKTGLWMCWLAHLSCFGFLLYE